MLATGLLAADAAHATCLNGTAPNLPPGTCTYTPGIWPVPHDVTCLLPSATGPYDVHVVYNSAGSTLEVFGTDGSGTSVCWLQNVTGAEPSWSIYVQGTNLNDRIDLVWGVYRLEPPATSIMAVEIRGGDGNDTLLGSTASASYDEVLYGEGDDDDLQTRAGGDLAYGGAGVDLINGGPDDDGLYGGPGNDEIHGHGGQDDLYGDDGTDDLYGGDGNDHLYGGAGIDFLYGGPMGDALYGEGDGDYLYGGGGSDVLDGGPGDDALWGMDGSMTATDGDDWLTGGDGRDFLHGERGNDLLCGGDEPGTPDDDELFGGLGDDFLWGLESSSTTVGLDNDGAAGDGLLDPGNPSDFDTCDAWSASAYGATCDVYTATAPAWHWCP